MTPAVTVVVPVRNGEAFIGQTLDSLLAQTFTDFVVVVIDDASTDGTDAILQRYTDERRMRVVRSEICLGAAGARNRGLDLARSHYVAFCDGDDVANPRRLERQMAFLSSHPGVQMLGADVTLIDAHGRPTGADWCMEAPGDVGPSMLFGNCLLTSTIIVERALIGEDRFDQTLSPVEDYDLWARVSARGRVEGLPEILAQYRVHEAGISRTLRDNTERSLRIIARKQLARLGLTPSHEQLELHRRLMSRDVPGTAAFAATASAWFETLQQANASHGTYDVNSLRRVIAAHWLHVCDATARAGAWRAWPVMVSSRLTGVLVRDPHLALRHHTIGKDPARPRLTSRSVMARLPWRTARGLVRRCWPTLGRSVLGRVVRAFRGGARHAW
jgi:glycosyltransferase involved in cell wall biosynthesis